jgi:hypothetical protein
MGMLANSHFPWEKQLDGAKRVFLGRFLKSADIPGRPARLP